MKTIGNINAVLAAVRKGRVFAVTSHVNPDGDSIGSSLALRHILRSLGKNAEVVMDGECPKELTFLPGSGTVIFDPAGYRATPDTVVFVDCGSIDRIGRVSRLLKNGAAVVNIDHHISNTRFGDVKWIETDSASVGELIWRMADELGVKKTREFAVNVYTSLVTETGNFTFSNTTEKAHFLASELIKLGVRPIDVTYGLIKNKRLPDIHLLARVMGRIRVALGGEYAWTELHAKDRNLTKPGDSQEYLFSMVSLKGVRACFLFRETEDGVKVSMRSDGSMDGSVLMVRFGGGGHSRAAGCTIHAPLAKARKLVLSAAAAMLRNRP